MNKNTLLAKYSKNIFSQFGEDGIIEEILKRINLKNGVCVEFGAWDGVFLSNTANLWTKTGWKGVLIESDKSRFEEMLKVTDKCNCVCINKFLKPEGKDSLENTLLNEKIDINSVDILSMDIDGNEYYILKNVEKMSPKLIITEYNPTIPPEIDIVPEIDSHLGASAKTLTDLANKKGYELIAITKTNCFFIKNEYYELFNDVETDIKDIFPRNNLSYLITNYYGDYFFSSNPCFGIGLPMKKEKVKKGKVFFIKHSTFKVRLNRIKDKIKEPIKSYIGYKKLEKWRRIKTYIIWNLKGRKIPPHTFYKWKILKKHGKKYGIKNFIETGTFGGSTIRELSKHFEKLYSIELDPTLFYQSKGNLHDLNNVKLLKGDSGEKIKEVLDELKEPAIFWLDAHYSGEGTARASKDTPVVEELNNILENGNKQNIIIIDDARCFNGENYYPTIKEMDSIVNSFQSHNLKVEKDIIIIKPIEYGNK